MKPGPIPKIAVINATVLTVLLLLYSDKLDRILNSYTIFHRMIGIVLISLFSMAAMRLFAGNIRKEYTVSPVKRIILASAITIFISSFFYYSSITNAVNHLKNRSLRNSLASKSTRTGRLNGIRSTDMTWNEFLLFSEEEGLKSNIIESSASHITCEYAYDGMLPDYDITITYIIPMSTQVDTLDYNDGDLLKTRTVAIKDSCKFITYKEISF